MTTKTVDASVALFTMAYGQSEVRLSEPFMDLTDTGEPYFEGWTAKEVQDRMVEYYRDKAMRIESMSVKDFVKDQGFGDEQGYGDA